MIVWTVTLRRMIVRMYKSTEESTMIKLTGKSQRWLKAIHLLFAAVWTSSGITLIALQLGLTPTNGGELHGMLLAAKFVDDFMIVPAAIGCLMTGLIYSIWTNWGFFKHRWITVKWIINVGGILFGTFFLGVWLNSLPPIAAELGMDALNDPVFLHNQSQNLTWGSIQVSTIVFALVISALKPWGRKKAAGSEDK